MRKKHQIAGNGGIVSTSGDYSHTFSEKLKLRQRKKTSNKRISKVLENLCENYLEGFPFLKYYHEFRKEYESARRRQVHYEIPKYFDEANIIKETLINSIPVRL